MERRHRTRRDQGCQLPGDFPERLKGLKEASGLSWKALAQRLGVKVLGVRRWRRRLEPTGRAMLGLPQLGWKVPGGVAAIFPEDAKALRGTE